MKISRPSLSMGAGRFVGMLLLVLLTACAARPSATASIAVVDPANASTLNMYRPPEGLHGVTLKFKTYVDGNLVGNLSSSSPISIQVPAGVHEVAVQAELAGISNREPTLLKVSAEPGKSYFIRFSSVTTSIKVIGTAVSGQVARELRLVSEDDWRARR